MWADNQTMAEGSMERCRVTSDRCGAAKQGSPALQTWVILKISHTWDGQLRHLPVGRKSCSRGLEASAVTDMTPSELAQGTSEVSQGPG